MATNMKSSSATGTCKICESSFKYARINQPRMYCSDGCRRQAKNGRRRQGLLGPASGICKTCGESFQYNRVGSRERLYCSGRCYSDSLRSKRRARRPEVLVATCIRCGVEFTHANHMMRRGACSDACRMELRRGSRARYRQNHKKELAAYNRAWLEVNRARHQATTRRWRARNPEKVRVMARGRVIPQPMKREIQRRYRARRRELTVVAFTLDQLAARVSMFAGCWMCGGDWSEIDHVKPLSRGGAHCLANLRPACRSCNARKSNRWPYVPTVRPCVKAAEQTAI